MTYNKRVSVAFGNLRQACIRNGFMPHLRLRDNGQTITIGSMTTGAEVFRWDSDWGDASPINEAAEWLIEHGHIKPEDLEG